MELLALGGAFVSFTVSAAAGLGGSLVLVPLLIVTMGTKEGIALAALLLACNNLFKVVAYRSTIPIRAALWVIVLTMVGALVGAMLLVKVRTEVIEVAVLISILFTVLAERLRWNQANRRASPVFALGSGLFSGFSGTSGPMKGIALRALKLDRFYLVGAASCVSLAGDIAKSAVFWQADLLVDEHLPFMMMAVPLMPLATWCGRRINREIGERAYAWLFWMVMLGYTVRLAIV